MKLIELSVSGGALIALVAILRFVAVKRLPRRLIALMWALAVLKLWVPVTLNVLPAQAVSEPVTAITETFQASETPTVFEKSETAKTVRIPYMQIGYFVGVSGVLIYYAIGQIGLYRAFRNAERFNELICDELKGKIGIRRRVRFVRSERITGGLTYGTLFPVVVIGAGVDANNRLQTETVLIHELTHVRRLDTAKKLVLALTLALHWFNPLVWLMYRLTFEDIELGCDAESLRFLGLERRKSYAVCLIDLEEKRAERFNAAFLSKSLVERRIRMIMSKKKKSILLAFIAVILTAGVFVGTSLRARADNKLTTENVAKERKSGMEIAETVNVNIMKRRPKSDYLPSGIIRFYTGDDYTFLKFDDNLPLNVFVGKDGTFVAIINSAVYENYDGIFHACNAIRNPDEYGIGKDDICIYNDAYDSYDYVARGGNFCKVVNMKHKETASELLKCLDNYLA